jgi:hypothetical protein
MPHKAPHPHKALEGKIIGFQTNNLKLGFAPSTSKEAHEFKETIAAIQKKLSAQPIVDPVTLNIYLSEVGRGPDFDPDDKEQRPLKHWVKHKVDPNESNIIILSDDKLDEEWDFNGITEDYEPNYFETPYTLEVPGAMTLMEIMMLFVDEAVWDPEDERVPSNISNVLVSSDTLTDGGIGIPDWLEGFRFHGSCIDGPYWEFVSHGIYYTQDPTGRDTPIYVMWRGSAWMLMIGTPNVPTTSIDPRWSSEHGEGFPRIRLDEIVVEDIPETPSPLDPEAMGINIVLCYTTMEVPIDHNTTEGEDGKTVHTLTHAPKS